MHLTNKQRNKQTRATPCATPNTRCYQHSIHANDNKTTLHVFGAMQMIKADVFGGQRLTFFHTKNKADVCGRTDCK